MEWVRGVVLSWVIFWFVSHSTALASEAFNDLNNRVGSLEKQVELSCNLSGNRTDPVRNLIAEKILARDSATAKLVKELKQRADQTTTELDTAEAVVAKIDAGTIQNKKDAAHAKLDIALKKLSQSESKRTPASVDSSLQEEVRSLYSQFKSSDSDETVTAMLDIHTKNFRQNKLSELSSLANLGERVGSALKKAGQCFCRGNSDECKSTDTLKDEAEYFNQRAIHKEKQAKVSGAATGSVQAATTAFIH